MSSQVVPQILGIELAWKKTCWVSWVSWVSWIHGEQDVVTGIVQDLHLKFSHSQGFFVRQMIRVHLCFQIWIITQLQIWTSTYQPDYARLVDS